MKQLFYSRFDTSNPTRFHVLRKPNRLVVRPAGHSPDLKQADIAVPAGSLIQLYEGMNALAEQLKGVVNRLG